MELLVGEKWDLRVVRRRLPHNQRLQRTADAAR
jgi:hypothetical protein